MRPVLCTKMLLELHYSSMRFQNSGTPWENIKENFWLLPYTPTLSEFHNRSVKSGGKCSLIVIISFSAVLKFVFHSRKRLALKTPANSLFRENK